MTNLKNIAIAVASIVLFSNSTHAQITKASYSVNYEEPLKVKYLGEDGDYLRFAITMESKSLPKAKFTIEDKNEGELYSSVFETTFKSQTIKIEKGGYQSLHFNLVLDGTTFSKSFIINTNLIETTTVAERNITKL
jgi:hypothetical protein